MRHFKKDRPKWQQKLGVREIRHLEEMGIRTLAQAKRNATWQQTRRAEANSRDVPPGIGEPCFECKTISRKLGLPI